jgi:hypothetical protein
MVNLPKENPEGLEDLQGLNCAIGKSKSMLFQANNRNDMIANQE